MVEQTLLVKVVWLAIVVLLAMAMTAFDAAPAQAAAPEIGDNGEVISTCAPDGSP